MNWLLDAAVAFFYPDWCQICRAEPSNAREGYVGRTCRSRPDGVRFVEPPWCGRCGLPYEGAIDHAFVCGNCARQVWHISHARAAVVATPLILDVIHRYKYHRAMWFEPFLADLLIQRAAPNLALESWHGLVPVPLHPSRQREREFNQAERLARRLSTATGIPLNTRLVQRVEPTRTQTMLSRNRRAENVRRAFALAGGRVPKGSRFVLVDDVLTTGATTNACALVLRRAGAAEICVWTVARGV
ncbi:MAG TPA: ComF family protein [Verrucomicrobiota bacterium]|nr:ComF family protein [Verrucomicrobiota bacterium]HNU51671.1 ComF family protein [Verrucomicrobiota bacterium]